MIQEIFLRKYLTSQSFYAQATELLPSAGLKLTEYAVCKSSQKFFEQFKRLPTRQELLLKMSSECLPDDWQQNAATYRSTINGAFSAKVDDVADDVLLSQLHESSTKQTMQDELVKIAQQFDFLPAEEIRVKLQDLVFSQHMTSGRDAIVETFTNNLDKNMPMLQYRGEDKCSTGIASLDHALFGGFGVRELTCFVSPSGRGKTVLLANIASNMTLTGRNVLFITLETSINDILRRTYRRIMHADKSFLSDEKNIDIAKKHLQMYYTPQNTRECIQYFPANTFSVEDLRADLMRLEIEHNFKPDCIIVDHLDLMTTKKVSIRQKEMHTYWRLLVDELREIALERCIPVVTATQSNRASSKKTVVGDDDVGESYGKIQSSDLVISINQTPDEYKNNRLRLCVVKNRDYLKGTIVELYSNLDFMLICDLQYAMNHNMLGDGNGY